MADAPKEVWLWKNIAMRDAAPAQDHELKGDWPKVRYVRGDDADRWKRERDALLEACKEITAAIVTREDEPEALLIHICNRAEDAVEEYGEGEDG